MQRTLSGRRDSAVLKEGGLHKLGDFRKNWKFRHFRLMVDQIQYRRKPHHVHPAGIIDLRGSAVSMEHVDGEQELHIRSPSQERVFRLRGVKEELEQWRKAIAAQIEAHKHTAHESIRRGGSVIRPPKSSVGSKGSYRLRAISTASMHGNTALSRFAVVRQGWLEKRGQKNTSWRRRYFVLRQGRLDYFKTEGMTIPLGTIILSEGSSEISETDNPVQKQLRINSPFQSRVFYLRGVSQEIEEWSELILPRHNDPRPVRAEDDMESRPASIMAPCFRRVGAKNSRLGDKFRKIAAGPRLCKMFCNGRGCKYCDYERWISSSQAIRGLYSSWITDSILAMSRPTKEAIDRNHIIDQFKEKGISAVINLQEINEHASCGFGNLQCGYSYNPDTFSSEGINMLIFGWKDFGVPKTNIAFDMVKAAAVELEGGKVAVHCHAGLGRTGMLIACILCFTLGYSGDEAISFVRVRRKGAIQTRKQVEFVKNFAAEVLSKRRVFPDALDRKGAGPGAMISGIPIRKQLVNQEFLTLPTEPQTLLRVPRVVYEMTKALSNIDWAAEPTASTLTKTQLQDLTEEQQGWLATYEIEANHGQWLDLRKCNSLVVLLVLAFEWQRATRDAALNSAHVRVLEACIANKTVDSWEKHLSSVPRAFLAVAAHVVRSALKHKLSVDPVLYLCQLAATLGCWLNGRQDVQPVTSKEIEYMKETTLALGGTFDAGNPDVIPQPDLCVLRAPRRETFSSFQEPDYPSRDQHSQSHVILGVMLLYMASQKPCYEELDLFEAKHDRPRAPSFAVQRNDVDLEDFESDSSSSSGSSSSESDDEDDEEREGMSQGADAAATTSTDTVADDGADSASAHEALKDQ